ncbi:MAG TPA: hypothetical protein VN032_09190 [Thermoanaerobaculia bacterium]|jgi:hypothetical protein|nr:hypothetical protein [Thermoanaerobaculia bacterium]
MRRLCVAGLLLVALAASLAAASPDKTRTHGLSVSGTVGKIDGAAKTFVVRTSAGKDTTLVRTPATKVNGEGLKSGDRVVVRYLERDGKKVATSIRIEPAAVAAATPTAPAPATR